MTAQPPRPDLAAINKRRMHRLDLNGSSEHTRSASDDISLLVNYVLAQDALIAAAEAATRRGTIAEIVALLDREASTHFDRFMSYELASSDGAAALRDAIQKVRALLPQTPDATGEGAK